MRGRVVLLLFLLVIQTGNMILSAQLALVQAEEQVFVTPARVGTHNVPEGSGIVASRVYPDVYWMISDWGNPALLYAVNGMGQGVKSFTVNGATGFNDWEDIAMDENNNIWIADIGDNSASRSSYRFYKVREPDPHGVATSVTATAFRFNYPDGSRDSNSAFVWQEVPYVIDTTDKARVYKLPVLDPSITVTAELVVSYTGASWVRGADVSGDGRRLALLSQRNEYTLVIERDPSSASVKDFFDFPTRQWRISFDIGGLEGIAFLFGKYDFIMESEGGGIWKVGQDQYDLQPIPPPDPPPDPPPADGYTLTWENYDAENSGEVSVLLNNQHALTYPSAEVPANNDAWISMSVDITEYVAPGANTLVFRENEGSGKIGNVVVVDSNGSVIFSDPTERWCWTPDNQNITYTISIPALSPSEASAPFFTFAASGDFNDEPDDNRTGPLLDRLASSGVSFLLALGDLGYAPDEQQWCNWTKARFNDILIIAGNHDTSEDGPSDISSSALYCPFTLASEGVVLDGAPGTPSDGYGYAYYFDYPATTPLARFILVPFGNSGCVSEQTLFCFTSLDWTTPGSAQRNWFETAISSAQSSGLWVVVGVHEECISSAMRGCDTGQTTFDLMISLGVDLILFANNHVYDRSKQLAHSVDCPTVSSDTADPDCVVDSTSAYEKGSGSVVVTQGTGGKELYQVSCEATYYAASMGGSSACAGSGTGADGRGSVRYTVNATSITALTDFDSPYTDSFSIESGPQPSPQQPDFTITANPASIGFPAGGSGTSTITLTSLNGFAGTVSLTDDSANCSLDPTSVTLTSGGTDASRLTCSNSTVGTFTVRVTGTSGVISKSVNITVTVSPPPDFTIGASSPSAANVGQSATSTITVTAVNDFSGTVSLSHGPLPSGLTCTAISPAFVAGSGTASLSCSSTVANSYNVTITGTNGSLVHTTTATFTFIPPPDFTISASVSNMSIYVGSSGTSTIFLESLNSFTGNVSLSATVSAVDVSGSLSPVYPSAFLRPTMVTLSANGSGESTLTVSTSHLTTPGTYAVKITATSGTISHSVTVTVTVTYV